MFVVSFKLICCLVKGVYLRTAHRCWFPVQYLYCKNSSTSMLSSYLLKQTFPFIDAVGELYRNSLGPTDCFVAKRAARPLRRCV